MLTLSAVTRHKNATNPPEHHIVTASTSQAASGWTSYLPSWAPSPERTRPSLTRSKTAGFRNPWPSWHKPTVAEIWDSFAWGEDDDGCIELAASRLATLPNQEKKLPSSKRPRFSDVDNWPDSLGAKASRLLRIEDPDFSFSSASKAKVTWLGHAGVLVQLPPLHPQDDRPVRCLFDPMFSTRCSPSQLAGPIRSYPPPCKVEDLPAIDAVCISHNHYDHMDYGSLMSVWRHSINTVRFFVPLGNKKWLLDWGIPNDRVVEMDWFDSAELTHPDSPTGNNNTSLKIWCTPAQHNSFRTGGDADSALWSSWYLEHHTSTNNPPYRVFFAGDTGYQFHPSPSWPPSPKHPAPNGPDTDTTKNADDNDNEPYPPCPAFADIRNHIGPPNLLLLPVSVGATFAYLRSFVPLPNWINPFPQHSQGVTGANHMPPWDAVRVLRVMTGGGFAVDSAGIRREEGGGRGAGSASDGGHEDGEGRVEESPVAVAMHWGTFVTDPGEVLKTLGAVEWACQRQGVRFARGLGELESGIDDGLGEGVRERKPVFVAVNHGGSVCL